MLEDEGEVGSRGGWRRLATNGRTNWGSILLDATGVYEFTWLVGIPYKRPGGLFEHCSREVSFGPLMHVATATRPSNAQPPDVTAEDTGRLTSTEC